jgi:hypothetical protein
VLKRYSRNFQMLSLSLAQIFTSLITPH